jgi:hypothetical protein
MQTDVIQISDNDRICLEQVQILVLLEFYVAFLVISIVFKTY